MARLGHKYASVTRQRGVKATSFLHFFGSVRIDEIENLKKWIKQAIGPQLYRASLLSLIPSSTRPERLSF